VIVRGVFLKATPFGPLIVPFLALVGLATAFFGLAMFRFRRVLTPTRAARAPEEAAA
jgi:hypothetical protein